MKNKNFVTLGIIGGIILLALLIGYLTGEVQLVVDILSAIGLLLIGITILVTVHELGHHLTAKAFGMRVETFSIGFPPKLFSFKKGETEYQVGATPLGGYVKISGMIDESLDTDYISQEPKPYEFRAKPVWQRLIVMTGGVIMNVILGILIFSAMKFIYPEIWTPADQIVYGIEVLPGDNNLGQLLGFKTGDSIISFKENRYRYFEEYTMQDRLIDDDAYYNVYRNGQVIRIDIPDTVQNILGDDSINGTLFIPDAPPILEVYDSIKVDDGEGKTIFFPAALAGIKDGDKVIRIDSTEISRFSDLRNYVRDKKNTTMIVQVERGTDSLTFHVKTDSTAKLGVNPDYAKIFNMDTVHYSFWESFPAGTKAAFGFLSTNVQGFKNLGKEGVSVSKSLKGPIQIAKFYLLAFKEGGVEYFLRLTGMLSMILAFVNILPIPAFGWRACSIFVNRSHYSKRAVYQGPYYCPTNRNGTDSWANAFCSLQ